MPTAGSRFRAASAAEHPLHIVGMIKSTAARNQPDGLAAGRAKRRTPVAAAP